MPERDPDGRWVHKESSGVGLYFLFLWRLHRWTEGPKLKLPGIARRRRIDEQAFIRTNDRGKEGCYMCGWIPSQALFDRQWESLHVCQT